MSTATQVARYIIERAAVETQFGPMTNLRLQKLLYYSQMESLVRLGRPIFDEPIMAWIHGPVVEPVYDQMAPYEDQPIDPQKEEKSQGIQPDERAVIDAAWNKYKQFSALELVDKTHREIPWLRARGDLGPQEKCRNAITHQDIREFGLRPPKRNLRNLPAETPIPKATTDKLAAYSKIVPPCNPADDDF
jgi:uncharacterized phage-associated protein